MKIAPRPVAIGIMVVLVALCALSLLGKKIGGPTTISATDLSNYKFVVTVNAYFSKSKYPIRCSGFFIRENIVATAAHCLYPVKNLKRIEVASISDTGATKTIFTAIDHYVNDKFKEAVKVSDDIRKKNKKYGLHPAGRALDIAFIRVKERSPNVAKTTFSLICIECIVNRMKSPPMIEALDLKLFFTQFVELFYFGPDEIQMALVGTSPCVGYDADTCPNDGEQKIRAVDVGVHPISQCDASDFMKRFTQVMFCVRGPSDKQLTWGGDSGGPVLAKSKNNELYVVGLISAGTDFPSDKQYALAPNLINASKYLHAFDPLE